jgi:dihydroxy-acid dehydratase
MLYGIGFTDDDMNKAQVGIASMGYDGNTCNMHLNDLAQVVKKVRGIRVWQGLFLIP